MSKFKIFASSSSWIEGAAEAQLRQTADLPGMEEIAAMPDLHPGKGCAVGVASYSKGIIYPHLIGNDFGCGYSFFKTEIKVDKVKPEKLAEALKGLDNEIDNGKKILREWGIASDHVNGLGTIGGGNHFAELQKFVELDSQAQVTLNNISTDHLALLVHSGSRSLGEAIYQKYAAICGNKGLEENTKDFDEYMFAHNEAVSWAQCNRYIIAKRLTECLNSGIIRVLELPHNQISKYKDGYLHRKGAAPADRGLSPLPGSRGTPTYLLRPTQSLDGLSSLAHGAGRKSSRANMQGRVTETTKQMETTSFGGVVVCGNDLLMKEEHPKAYKDVNRVLQDLKDFDLATDVATLHPILTYKSERNKENSTKIPKRDKESGWRQERRNSSRGRR